MATTLVIVGGVLVITVILGVLRALLLDQPIWGQGIVRILVIAPFFVMPTVSGLVWKNMFMDPVNGFFAHLWRAFGAEPIQWLSQASLPSMIMIISWQWLPFATLILLTAIQSLDSEQLEAAEMDGAGPFGRFCFIILPHLARAITVVVLIQTIFLLSIFAEIFVTTAGAFGTKTLTYLIFQRVLESQNVGLGSAGGVYAIILANIVAIFLMRIVGKNLDGEEIEIMARTVSTRRKTINTIAAWIIGATIFFPILWIIVLSFKAEGDAIKDADRGADLGLDF